MSLINRRKFILTTLAAVALAPSVNALTVNGTEYISIPRLAQLCGMRYATITPKKVQSVFSKTSKLIFTVHSRSMTLNGVKVWLGNPVVEYKGALHISNRDFLKSICAILYPQKNGAVPKLFHICIDAGHGGKDDGTSNKAFKAKEKHVALDIALKLGKELQRQGYKVSYTRTTDVFLELGDRPAKANSLRADMFLSIHCNAASPSASGIETFALTPRYAMSTSSSKSYASDKIALVGNNKDGWNQLLAYNIQRYLKGATGNVDRGVKRARFAVLKTPQMPAALIECGFLSNYSDCKNLMSYPYRTKIAQAITRAIMNYHNTLRRLS